MKFNLADLKKNYEQDHAKSRELYKYLFSVFTFGLGAVWLWLTTRVIKEGQIGLREDARGNMILLPPGRHSNFPWESYPCSVRDLSRETITMGPYTIVTVESGYVAKTLNKGKLEILTEGQHLLDNASHVFKEYLSIKQETKRLEAVQAYTNDNVGITLHADVRYQISEPELAITKIDDIEESIKQISEMQLSSVIGHHNLQELIPATKGLNIINDSFTPSSTAAVKEHGLSNVVQELMANVAEKLKELGITLINIGIKSWTINDKQLAHELAQGAVIQSQTASKLLTAKRDAEIMIINAEAKAEAIRKEAQGMADAGKTLDASPTAQCLATHNAQAKVIAAANPGTNLFYGLNTGTPGFFQVPVMTTSRRVEDDKVSAALVGQAH